VNYNAAATNRTITVSKATPTVYQWALSDPTITYGHKLSTIPLVGGATSVPGTFNWTNSDEETINVYNFTSDRAANKGITFTPNDTSNYNNVTSDFALDPIKIGMVTVKRTADIENWDPKQFRFNQTTNAGSNYLRILSRHTFVGKYQVTQELYEIVMTGNKNGINPKPSYFSSQPAAGEIQKLRPVENMCWAEAIVFCNRLSVMEGFSPVYSLNGSYDVDTWGNYTDAWNEEIVYTWATSRNGYRLLTEVEWEYAAKGGHKMSNPLYTYSGSNTLTAVGWVQSNSNSMTHEVGKLMANEVGIYDMSGNVWEWCFDYAENGTANNNKSSSTQTNHYVRTKSADADYWNRHSIRGGRYLDDNGSSNFRYWDHGCYGGIQFSRSIGFRIARTDMTDPGP